MYSAHVRIYITLYTDNLEYMYIHSTCSSVKTLLSVLHIGAKESLYTVYSENVRRTHTCTCTLH